MENSTSLVIASALEKTKVFTFLHITKVLSCKIKKKNALKLCFGTSNIKFILKYQITLPRGRSSFKYISKTTQSNELKFCIRFFEILRNQFEERYM